MMKYSDEQKQKFRDLVAQGKPIKDAAAEAGISLAIGKVIRVQDNRKERENSTSPPAVKEEEKQEEENLSEGDVPPPESGSGGAADGSGARGADGARSALQDEEDDKEHGEKEEGDTDDAEDGEEEPQEKVDPEYAAEVLVDISEMLAAGVLWLFTRKKKIKLTSKQKDELEWSKDDRERMLKHARRAVKALPDFIALLGPYVGLAFYCYALFRMTGARCERASEMGGKREDSDDEERGEEEEIKDADWEEKRPSAMNDNKEDW